MKTRAEMRRTYVNARLDELQGVTPPLQANWRQQHKDQAHAEFNDFMRSEIEKAIKDDRAERRDELSNQLPAITPKTHGMDWEELAEWLHYEKEAAAKRAAREVLLQHAVKEPALDPRYWLLVHAAMIGFEARDEL